MMRQTMQKLNRAMPWRRIIVMALLGITTLVSVGVVAAHMGHPQLLSLIPGSTALYKGVNNTAAPAAGETQASPTSTPTSTAITTPTPKVPTYEDVSGKLGGHGGGPARSVPMNHKPLILSATSLTVTVGSNTALITATNPDNASMCFVNSTGAGGLYVGYTGNGTSIPCQAAQTFFLFPATKPGVYNVQLYSDSQQKTGNGMYTRYDGYVKVTVTSPPSFWLTAGQQQITSNASGPQTIRVPLTVTRDSGYTGNPQITHAASDSSWCTSQSLDQVNASTYVWTCQVTQPAGHHLYGLNFFGNDGINQRQDWINVSY